MTAASVQKLWKCEKEYYEFCREERNIAAILYHALLLPGNLEKFLGLIGWEHTRHCENAPIYFEYSYLRDFWHKKVTGNDEKKCLILNTLKPPNRRYLSKSTVQNFNQYFGGKKSSDKIVFPGTWSTTRMNMDMEKDFFLDVCIFKWAFNIKPDIVIHIDTQTAVCVEAKFESKESKYPTSKSDKEEFKKRLGSVEYYRYRQTEIQKYMFEKALGMENAKFVFLTKEERRKTETTEGYNLTWDKVFGAMNLDSAPKFIRYWVEHIKNECQQKNKG